ncbi:hypothetical protein GS4_09_00300 [Gordonia soli NBRC 108243]|uniref:Uncharacterized protein n=1 Tax=Gordonia soli NBRC 108243 TaxID=1223545 RepID=M0QHC3_9ACTN|nr:hypothetical protein GS4_09_00300 [Gordonia soli NBRC 108243]
MIDLNNVARALGRPENGGPTDVPATDKPDEATPTIDRIPSAQSPARCTGPAEADHMSLPLTIYTPAGFCGREFPNEGLSNTVRPQQITYLPVFVDHAADGDLGDLSGFEVLERAVSVEHAGTRSAINRGAVGVLVDEEASVRLTGDIVDLVSPSVESEDGYR